MVFGDLGWAEVAVLLVLALFVFGPDRLPGLAQDVGRTIRKGRTMLRGMTADLKAELGPEVGDLDLASLHPKRFVESIWNEDDEPVRPQRSADLSAGELAPWDPDTT